MSVACSSVNHDQLMSGFDLGASPKAKKNRFDLEMFGSSKPLRATKSAVLSELTGLPNKKQAINKVIDLNESSSSEPSSSCSHSVKEVKNKKPEMLI